MVKQLSLFEEVPTPANAPPDIPERVVGLFEKMALHIAGELKYKRYSARAIIDRIRWHEEIEKGNHAFKCGNNYTPDLARWFMRAHPEHAGFFVTRALFKKDR